MGRTRIERRIRAAAALAGLALALRAAPARACGGFFCDGPGSSGLPPIAQSGENVLFAMDRDPVTGEQRVEAHIQILYTGAADQFSWIVPVTSVPTVDVGTDLLFQFIEPATRPVFTPQLQIDGTCKGQGADSGFGCGTRTSASGGRAYDAASVVDGPSVDVIFHGNVGPYETVIVSASEPDRLRSFLTTNGFIVSDDASRIIDEYVAKNSAFVAIRLQPGQDTSAIRPIVLRFPATEACLPLKLTAVASVPNLRISVWVLAEARAVPLNYTEIDVNLTRIDWINFGANYDSLLGAAADEAGGNAFAVEYARPSALLASQVAIPPDQIAALPSQTNLGDFATVLYGLGFAPTGEVLDVLRADVPLPPELAAQGVTEAVFYQNLVNYGYAYPPAFFRFDPIKTTADLQTQVFDVRARLQPLFDSHPYLTRLATFISPEEMNVDPLFVPNPDLPEVVSQHQAEVHYLCGDEEVDFCHAPVRARLDDGREIMYAVAADSPSGCTYDRADIDALPAAEIAWRREAHGPGDVVMDQRPAIETGLQRHNSAVLASLDGGCACAVGGRSRHLGLALTAAGLIAILRLRRRGRR